MKLILVRHAQTDANVTKVWHGHTDTPLNDTGLNQIELLGKSFHQIMTPDVIYASPLQRTRMTAEAIAKNFNIDIRTKKSLIEFGVGEWEGESFERLNGELDFMPRFIKDEHHRAPGGESRFDVKQRMIAAIEEIAEEHSGQNVVVVSHGVALSLALGHWFGQDEDAWTKFHKDNTATTEVSLDPLQLISFNQTNHLQ